MELQIPYTYTQGTLQDKCGHCMGLGISQAG